MSQDLDDPETNWRLVRSLLTLAPFLFVGSIALALVQGASRYHSLIIAGIALAGCLGAAATIHVFRSHSRTVLAVFSVVVGLLAAIFGR